MIHSGRKLSAHLILTPQGWLQNGILRFDTEGTLLEVLSENRIDSQDHVEFFNGILIPGMVNAHCHLELSYLRGKISPGSGFAGFADAMSQVRGDASAEQRIQAAAYWDYRMFEEGITAVGDICNGDSTFELKQKSRIYYHNFIEGFGLRCTDFSFLGRLTDEARKYGLSASATPHSTYSLQDKTFRQIAADSQHLSVHFMESPSETELFQRKGELHARNVRDAIEIDFTGYGSPADRILVSVSGDKTVLLVHNTLVNDEELRTLDAHFTTHATWVLCPRSNHYIEGLQPPVSLLHKSGVRIAVGTDSLASNHTLSLLEELKQFPDIPLQERFYWATLNGAEALGIASWAGSFTPGKRPGAVVVTGIDWNTLNLTPHASSHRIL